MMPVNEKIVKITPPGAVVDNAAFATATLDTVQDGHRCDHVSIYVQFGALDVAVTALKVTESDASNMSGATDVPGTVVGTDANDAGATSALPTATANDTFVKFEIDLRGRKRYLDLQLTGGDGTAGTYASAFALFKRVGHSPATAAQKGVAQVMRSPVVP